MLGKITTVLAGLTSLLLLVVGARWQIDPAGAATELGMPLLDGVGRSTQIGDLSAFFIVGAVFGLIGVFKRNAMLLYTPAALVAGAALFRTSAWAFHGADLAPMIGPEIVMAIIYIAAIRNMRSASA